MSEEAILLPRLRPMHRKQNPTLTIFQSDKMMRISHLLIWLLASLSHLAVVAESDIISPYDAARTLRGKKPGKGQKCGKKPCRPAGEVSCPTVSPPINGTNTCTVKGQKCTFEYGSTIPGGICTNKDVCTCKKGKWDCDRQIGCVSDNPPFIPECPKISPIASNTTVCEDPSQQECTFEYESTVPGGICQNKDVCSCVDGEWKCPTIEIGCVSDNPPSLTIAP
jgi:hypothetical protein